MKTIRTLTPEVRLIDRAKGIVDYVASDPTLDSYNEIIDPRGWRFERFKKNAPFVDSHDYSTIAKQLGEVTDFRVEGSQLVERVRWAIEAMDENPLIRLGWKMTLGGFLKAVSVGFMPVRYVSKWGTDPQRMADAVKELNLTPETAAKVSCIYLEQDQLELSACIIGANPNALAKAHRDGAIADGDLAACGFDDEGMQFLQEADAELNAQQNAAAQALIRNLFAQFARTLSTGQTKTATSASVSAAAEEARQRSSFLSELKTTTQTITR